MINDVDKQIIREFDGAILTFIKSLLMSGIQDVTLSSFSIN